MHELDNGGVFSFFLSFSLSLSLSLSLVRVSFFYVLIALEFFSNRSRPNGARARCIYELSDDLALIRSGSVRKRGDKKYNHTTATNSPPPQMTVVVVGVVVAVQNSPVEKIPRAGDAT